MIADNRIFNVNGKSEQELAAALSLVLLLHDCDEGFSGFSFDSGKGLLLWRSEGKNVTKFIVPVNGFTAAKLAFNWLKSKEAMSIPFIEWDANVDHDGHNELGWRAYLEDWGKVGDNHGVLIAIKPSYLWLGK